jgi:hypothetical protein
MINPPVSSTANLSKLNFSWLWTEMAFSAVAIDEDADTLEYAGCSTHAGFKHSAEFVITPIRPWNFR